MVIGVDGCRAGWLAVRMCNGSSPEIRTFATIGELWQVWGGGCELLLIDIPIGLSESESSRECDRRARRLLGAPRASSIFNPPVRAALRASSWKEAAGINEAVTGKRISRQGWGIVPKIREIDDFVRGLPGLQHVVRETHPEVLFAALNDGVPPARRKKDAAGVEERLSILEKHFAGAAALARREFRLFPGREVERDDIVDALVAAVVAYRYRDSLSSLPTDAPTDSYGLRMSIAVPDLQVEL